MVMVLVVWMVIVKMMIMAATMMAVILELKSMLGDFDNYDP